jgi:hypothetical protein
LGPDFNLVWNQNLKLWTLVMGGHVEYITPDEFGLLNDNSLRVTVHTRLMNFAQSVNGKAHYRIH